ncbi:MAG TPA: peroxiredoxin [Thermoplasmata archaeon]|nr:peroxiredoxin [Thermoplasmata archaeon]
MVAKGEMAPEFTGTIDDGSKLSLASLRGSRVFLYFYPEADTPGCTIESKGLNDRLETLTGKGIKVVGVSTDSVDKQCAFRDKYGFRFPLVADQDKAVAKLYGVLGPGGRARRVSFVVDATGRVSEVIEGKADLHLAAADRLVAG